MKMEVEVNQPIPCYSASVFWGPREETSMQVAERIIYALARLKTIHPVLTDWYYSQGFKPAVALNPSLGAVAARIASLSSRKEDGSPDLQWGFRWCLINTDDDDFTPRHIPLDGRCGITNRILNNCVTISTEPFCYPDPDLITFDFFRRALIALAESFEAVVGTVCSNSLIDLWPQGQSMPLPLAWISYLAPAYTSLVAPPPRAIVEHRPDGGLLMSATSDTFMTNNAAHLAVAREIEAAVAPFNALPWPQNPVQL